MKNLSPTENREQILNSTRTMFSQDPSTRFNTQEGVDEVIDYMTKVNRMLMDIEEEYEGRLHLYGAQLPIVNAMSDYGDATKAIAMSEERFRSIQSMKEYIQERLNDNQEVYIHTFDYYKIISPTSFQPEFWYLMRVNTVDRSEWGALISQQTAVESPWFDASNYLNSIRMGCDLTEGRTGDNIGVTIQPKEDEDSFVQGRIKNHKF